MMVTGIILLLSVISWIYVRNILKPSSKYGPNINSFDRYIDDKVLCQTEGEMHDTTEKKYNPFYDDPGKQILIFYGTEYGFSEEVARVLFDRLVNMVSISEELHHLQPRLLNMKHGKHLKLQDEQLVLIIVSTSGDDFSCLGIPPSSAMDWYESFMSSATDLAHLKFTVLALGDTNYPHFCRAGRKVYERFCELGACPLVGRADVDMEDWTVINIWMDKVQNAIKKHHTSLEVRLDYLSPLLVSACEEDDGYDRLKPFMARLLVKKALTKCDAISDKETIHCELSIEGSMLNYEAGDAVGIYPTNRMEDVDWVLKAGGFDGDLLCAPPASAYYPKPAISTLREILEKYYDLKNVRVSLLQSLLKHSEGDIKNKLENLLENGTSRSNQALMSYLETVEVVDVLEDFPINVPQQELLANLRSLQPRYYSISSSSVTFYIFLMMQESDKICVTAAVIRYFSRRRPRVGVATTFLQDRLHINDLCPIFISPNPDFRLPKDGTRDLIMIGPGTGIAPFRAFLQERVLSSTGGKNLLYFGCRRKSQDFLYQEELEHWVQEGQLMLRTAFSRDGEKKVYVQHLIQEDGHMIWNMIQGGAHIYVCGDAKHMAGDVHKALVDIIQVEGSMTTEDSLRYITELEDSQRYQKDVWIT